MVNWLRAPRRLVFTLAVFACALSPALAARVEDTQKAVPLDALVRLQSQFTKAQWQRLGTVRHTHLVLPLTVPPGYRVLDVQVQHQGGGPNAESYVVTYGNGSGRIEFFGANWSAGGDPGPDSFARQFRSSLFGTGGIAVGEGRSGPNCLLAYQLWRAPGGQVEKRGLMEYRGDNYEMQSCGPGLSPADFIRFIESAIELP
jgi:hypothetical protein